MLVKGAPGVPSTVHVTDPLSDLNYENNVLIVKFTTLLKGFKLFWDSIPHPSIFLCKCHLH